MVLETTGVCVSLCVLYPEILEGIEALMELAMGTCKGWEYTKYVVFDSD